MWFDVTEHSREIDRQINNLVGKPFSWLQRIKMKGIGSQRLLVVEANTSLQEALDSQSAPPFTNIELRPKGLILWFRIKLDSYNLVLAFDQLTITNTEEDFTLNSNEWLVKLKPTNNQNLNLKFLEKVSNLENDNNI